MNTHPYFFLLLISATASLGTSQLIQDEKPDDTMSVTYHLAPDVVGHPSEIKVSADAALLERVKRKAAVHRRELAEQIWDDYLNVWFVDDTSRRHSNHLSLRTWEFDYAYSSRVQDLVLERAQEKLSGISAELAEDENEEATLARYLLRKLLRKGMGFPVRYFCTDQDLLRQLSEEYGLRFFQGAKFYLNELGED